MVKKHLQDSRKSVFFFWVVFILYSLIYMTKNCYAAAMASIVSEGIMTKSQTGTISAAFYLFYAPFQIVGGLAADRYSPYKLFLFGTLGGAICNFLVYFFSDNYTAMLILWSLNAIVQFGVWPSVFKIAAAQLHPEHRARAVFYVTFTATVGLALSYLCSTFIGNWKNNFIFSGFILIFVALAFFCSHRFVASAMVISETTDRVRDKTSDSPRPAALFWVLLKAGIPFILIVQTISSVLNLGLKVLVPVMLTETYTSITPNMANILNIVLIVVAPLGISLSRLPFWKKFCEPSAIMILLLASIPFLVLLTCVGTIPVFFIMASLALLMVALAALSIFVAYISKTFEKLGCSATLSGLFNCMSSLGIVLANYVFTRLAEQFGWSFTTISWLAIGVLGVLLAACSVPLWKRFIKTLPSE